MRKLASEPRADWRETVEAKGLIWHTVNERPYWDESAHYRFTIGEVGVIETATDQLYKLFLEAGDKVVRENLFHLFEIPELFVPAIRQAWEAEPPALNYGRFDLGWDGTGQPKMFEFNCDTPTSLLEAAVIQWDWRTETHPDLDQFNSLHEKLVARWREISPRLPSTTLHLASVDDDAGEDSVTIAYLADTAAEAGLSPRLIRMEDIGWDGRRFRDLQGGEMRAVFKLYPWEWMVHEAFGQNALTGDTLWLEPIWKMIWSNKAILPILWQIAPGHPNLLRAQFEAPTGENYVRKPILAREGANVAIFRKGQLVAESGGDYAAGSRAVYQELYDLPQFGDGYPVIGSWIVDGEPAGVGIREDGLITGNTARFVPHLIEGR